MSPTNQEKADAAAAKDNADDDLFNELDETYEETDTSELRDLPDGDYTMALSARLGSTKDGIPMFIWDAVVTGPTREGVGGSIFRVLNPEWMASFKKEMNALGVGHFKPSEWRENLPLMQNLHARVHGKRGKNPQYGPNWYINGLAEGEAPGKGGGVPAPDSSNTPF